MLSRRLAGRARPLRIAVVGCGAFGTMALSQLMRVGGLRVVAAIDREPERAHRALERIAGPAGATEPPQVGDDLQAALDAGIDVLVEATGSPVAAARHCVAAFAAGAAVVNVTVEADALLGPLLADRARAAGVAYSYASGDQPALICELVDWARLSGLEVVSAGKGTKHMLAYHASTPDTVWQHYGIDAEHAAREGLNARMFNSFLDGTKSAIEMAAVANATGLVPQPGGLRFPASTPERICSICIPERDGGALARSGTVEVVSSIAPDGEPLERDLRWGVYVVFAAPDDYVRARLAEYGVLTDPSGRYGALWRPYHLIGLEIGPSVARAALDGRPTGEPLALHADAVAVAKRDLTPGERLDGEGGATVWGRLEPHDPDAGALPIGLTEGARVVRPVAAGSTLGYEDVGGLDSELLALRAEAERAESARP